MMSITIVVGIIAYLFLAVTTTGILLRDTWKLGWFSSYRERQEKGYSSWNMSPFSPVFKDIKKRKEYLQLIQDAYAEHLVASIFGMFFPVVLPIGILQIVLFTLYKFFKKEDPAIPMAKVEKK